jgi:hypothetical protein
MQSTYFKYMALKLFDLIGSIGPTGITLRCISTELYHAPHLTLYISERGVYGLTRIFTPLSTYD